MTDSTLEPRVAKVEAAVEHIDTAVTEVRTDIRELRREAREDFRLLFGAIITPSLGLGALMLGLAGLMAHGFHWI